MRWAALLLLPPAIVAVQQRIETRLDRAQHHEERLMVWSGKAIARLYPGFEAVMADVYWLRAVQYFGGERAFNPGSRFELLEPLIHITVTLDPRFLLAYRYGAIFLAEHWPSGAGNPEAAAALLQRGIDANPEQWQLRWDLGTIRYLFLHQPERAAETLLDAAELPGAPEWLKSMAGRVLAETDHRQTARLIWQEIYRQGEGAMRENARANLQYLDAADVLDVLRARLTRRHEETGRWPGRLEEIQGPGARVLPLADPTGVPFRYDAETGAVTIDRRSTLWTLLPEDERELEPP